MLSILSADPIRPVHEIGWAFNGLAVGLIALFVAVDQCRKKDKITNSNWHVTKPIIRNVVAACALSTLISLLILVVYEPDYTGQLFNDFSVSLFLVLAIGYYLLNLLPERLENQT